MTAIILAAGFSKRFEGAKLLAEIDGKPVVQYVIETVEKSGFKDIILVGRLEGVKKLAGSRNIKVVHNKNAIDGISSSIKCGLSAAGATDAFMFFAGDQPFIDTETVQKLKDAFARGEGSIIVPRYGCVAGNPVIFAAEWTERLKKLTGDVGGRAIIKENPDKVRYVDIKNPKAGLDIDTREDYDIYKNKSSKTVNGLATKTE